MKKTLIALAILSMVTAATLTHADENGNHGYKIVSTKMSCTGNCDPELMKKMQTKHYTLENAPPEMKGLVDKLKKSNNLLDKIKKNTNKGVPLMKYATAEVTAWVAWFCQCL